MPYLADIPLIGFFFRGKSKSATQSSLLIFVTPTIIDTTGAKFFEAGGVATPASRRIATVKGPGATEESATPAEAPAEPLATPEAKAAPADASAEESAEPPADTSVEKSEAEKPQLEAPASTAAPSKS